MVKRPEQERIRIEKISYLEEKGVKPFGHRYDRTHNAETIVAEFDKYSKEELEQNNFTVKIAGRMMAKRRQGKIGFINILDKFGSTQCYLSKEVMGEEMYDIFI